MISVNIAVLKAKLSYYLNQVKRGEELLVMDRATPIATVRPSSENKAVLDLTAPPKPSGALKEIKPFRPQRKTDIVKLLREERERR